MPVSDPLLDPAYAELVGELRDARTPTPATLTTRVDELQARPRPVPVVPLRRRLHLPRRRVVLGIAGGCAVVVGGIWAASRLPATTSSSESAAPAVAGSVAAAQTMTVAAAVPSATYDVASSAETESLSTAKNAKTRDDRSATDVPAAGDITRLQHQTARLTIALPTADAVSDATTRVTSAIATYGGHIVTVQFATPEGTEARAEIVAKVPIERMQDATNRFSALGRLAGAQVDISDLQARADSLEQKVSGARLQIAKFDAQLAAADLTKLQKATLVERRARARQRLADLNASVSQTKQEAALADLTVVLVTDDQVVAPTKSSTGPGARAKDALGLLADVGVYAIYALVVMAPLLLVLAALIAVRKLARRRRDRRLLETA